MKRKSILGGLISIIMIIIPIIIAAGLIGVEIYIWSTYGDLPVNEIPAWALFFMFRR